MNYLDCLELRGQTSFLEMNLKEFNCNKLKGNNLYYQHILLNTFNNKNNTIDIMWDRIMLRDRVLRYR